MYYFFFYQHIVVQIYCHPGYTMPPFSMALHLFIQWKTAVWALVSLPSIQEHLHFVHPRSVWRKMQLPGPLTPGRVARSLPADYSYFHKLFLCVSALDCGSMSFWSLRHNSSFAGPGSMLLLDACTVIYQDQTTVGVSWNVQLSQKKPLADTVPANTSNRRAISSFKETAPYSRKTLNTGHGRSSENKSHASPKKLMFFFLRMYPKCFLLLVKTHFDGTMRWTIFHPCLYISVVHTAR